MIVLKKQSDFEKLNINKVNPLLITFLKEKFNTVCRQYKSTNLSRIGAFYLLENSKDCLKYKEIGLSLPMDKSVFEFAELTTLKRNADELNVWHFCFVISNDKAVSIFSTQDNLNKHITHSLLQDYVEREESV